MRRHTVPFLPRRFQALGDFFQDAPKLLPLMAAGVTGYYLGKSIPVMQLPLRLYLVFIGGAFMLFYTWKTGPFPGLLLAMLLVWTQHQYFNYPFIQPVLFEGPPPEVLVYTAFFYLSAEEAVRLRRRCPVFEAAACFCAIFHCAFPFWNSTGQAYVLAGAETVRYCPGFGLCSFGNYLEK